MYDESRKVKTVEEEKIFGHQITGNGILDRENNREKMKVTGVKTYVIENESAPRSGGGEETVIGI